MADDSLICSAKGCREPAAWGVLWNNPKIHRPERLKVWLACDAHRETLEEFLSRRDYFQRTIPADDVPALPPESQRR